MLSLDHIIVAISDLDLGIRQVHERVGVCPVIGGFHPQGVTKNALMSLGADRYLEIIALRDDIETPDERRWMLETKELRTIGWAVSSTDLAETKHHLDQAGFPTSKIVPGARQTPDGNHLSWSTMSLKKRIAGAPFFIQWGVGTPHPSATSPTGCNLQSFAITTPDHALLQSLLRALNLDVRVTTSTGPDPVFETMVESPNGLTTLQ
jgi:hypothetical protein